MMIVATHLLADDVEEWRNQLVHPLHVRHLRVQLGEDKKDAVQLNGRVHGQLLLRRLPVQGAPAIKTSSLLRPLRVVGWRAEHLASSPPAAEEVQAGIGTRHVLVDLVLQLAVAHTRAELLILLSLLLLLRARGLGHVRRGAVCTRGICKRLAEEFAAALPLNGLGSEELGGVKLVEVLLPGTHKPQQHSSLCSSHARVAKAGQW